jgi:hypothetical protein
MRSRTHSWTNTLTKLGFTRKRRKNHGKSDYAKRLRVEGLEDRRMLAAFTVTNLNDSGTGSLRQAILDANTSGGADTISFTTTGTITLTSGQLTITDDLAIEGPGADELTIDADGGSRIFSITSGDTVTLSGITVTGGLVSGANVHGGGILNAGNLTLDSVAVVDNQTASGRGGGVYSDTGNLIVHNSTFDDNSAVYGGGIYIHSAGGVVVQVDGSTFFGNTTTGSGGGMFINGGTTPGTAVITNSTFSGNYAGTFSAGLRAFDGANVNIINSTFTLNQAGSSSGGIGSFNGGSMVTLHNSIVAGNTAPSAADTDGAFHSSSSYNLIGVNTSAALNDTGDHNIVIGTGAPGLAALGHYGGITKTHPLELGSAAIDAGSDTIAVMSTDQRLRDRKYDHLSKANGVGGSVDIGAFELRAPGIADVVVAEDASNITIDLEAAFGYAGAYTDFEIVANTVAGLFSSATISDVSSVATLTLAFVADQSGTSWITVRGDNGSGAVDDLSFLVTVTPVNDDPEITAPANETTDENVTIVFSAANGNAITVGDVDLSAPLARILSPYIPDLHYSAQNAGRLYVNNNVDDFSAYGIGNSATALSSYLFQALPNQSLDHFISRTDAQIISALSIIPERFESWESVEDWEDWIEGRNPLVCVDIEGPALPANWPAILANPLQGETKLLEVFEAYKRRIDLAHEMYPTLRLMPWATPAAYLPTDEVSDLESQIKTLSMAIQYGVFDNAYALFPRAWLTWGPNDPNWHDVDNNVAAVAGASQEAIRRAVEATNGAKGSHLKVVVHNSWEVFNPTSLATNPFYGSGYHTQLLPEGYFQQLQGVQDIADGVTATIKSGTSTANLSVGQITSISTYELLGSTPLLDLNSYAAGLEDVLRANNLNTLEVTLEATHGTITLSGTTNLTFSVGDGTGDATMTFRGTIDDINAALDGLQFIPETDYFGEALLEIDVDDLGNIGSGGPQLDHHAIEIDISESFGLLMLANDESSSATSEETLKSLRPIELSKPISLGRQQQALQYHKNIDAVFSAGTRYRQQHLDLLHGQLIQKTLSRSTQSQLDRPQQAADKALNSLFADFDNLNIL